MFRWTLGALQRLPGLSFSQKELPRQLTVMEAILLRNFPLKEPFSKHRAYAIDIEFWNFKILVFFQRWTKTILYELHVMQFPQPNGCAKWVPALSCVGDIPLPSLDPQTGSPDSYLSLVLLSPSTRTRIVLQIVPSSLLFQFVTFTDAI
jgi:hypothetical protein